MGSALSLHAATPIPPTYLFFKENTETGENVYSVKLHRVQDRGFQLNEFNQKSINQIIRVKAMESTDKDDKKQPVWLAILLALIAALGGGGALTKYLLGLENKPPEAVIQIVEPPKVATNDRLSVFAGMVLEFDAYRSNDPEDGNNLKTIWQLKRGDQLLSSTTGVMEYKTPPLETGSYSLILTVKDGGNREHSARYRIDVGDDPARIDQNGTSNPSQSNNGASQPTPLAETWWQPWSADKGIPPQMALVVSFEAEDAKQIEPLFLCRAFDQGMWKPGKVLSSGPCIVPRYAVKNNTVDPDRSTRPSMSFSNYEIFVPEGSWRWVPATENINLESVISADDAQRSNTVICRIEYGQRNTEGKFRIAKHPGILDPSINHCIFPWGEVSGFRDIHDRSDTYEVLAIGSQ